MKKLTFIVAFLILIRPVIPVLEYVINYEYISKVLCENKEKPAMACNGKCHLMRELAKSAEGEKPVSEKKADLRSHETLFFQEIETIPSSNPYLMRHDRVHPHYINLYRSTDPTAAFHPPTLI